MAISLSHKNKNSDMDALKISKFRLLLPIQYKVQNIFNNNDSSAKKILVAQTAYLTDREKSRRTLDLK